MTHLLTETFSAVFLALAPRPAPRRRLGRLLLGTGFSLFTSALGVFLTMLGRWWARRKAAQA